MTDKLPSRSILVAKQSRKQLLDDLKKALKKERPENRESFLRGWKQVDQKLRKKHGQ